MSDIMTCMSFPQLLNWIRTEHDTRGSVFGVRRPYTAVPASTQTITVDLSPYEGTVDLRIVVGDVTVFHSGVDADMNTSKSVPATASGTQMVYIYINGQLVDSYPKPF